MNTNKNPAQQNDQQKSKLLPAIFRICFRLHAGQALWDNNSV